MYFMYVDESGDPGGTFNNTGNSKHFILTGIVVPANDWKPTFERVKIFRKYLNETYGLGFRTEIHASEIIRVNSISEYKTIRKTTRVKLFRDYISELPIIFQNSKLDFTIFVSGQAAAKVINSSSHLILSAEL